MIPGGHALNRLAIADCASANDAGGGIYDEANHERCCRGGDTDIRTLRAKTAFGLAERLTLRLDASGKDEEVCAPTGSRWQNSSVTQAHADVVAVNGITHGERHLAPARAKDVPPYIVFGRGEASMLDLWLEISGLRPHEDLKHSQRWIINARTFLVPKASPRIHDHQMISIDDQMSTMRIVVAHDAGWNPGDDFVPHVFVKLDMRAWGEKRLHDCRQGSKAMIGAISR